MGMSWPSSRSNFSGVSLFRMPLTCGGGGRLGAGASASAGSLARLRQPPCWLNPSLQAGDSGWKACLPPALS